MSIGIFISIVFILCACLTFVIFYNNYLYNAVFERKSRKLWKFFIKNADKFEYVTDTGLEKRFVWGDYIAIIWSDNTCSIHVKTPNIRKCLVSPFDIVMSNKMFELLLDKIK